MLEQRDGILLAGATGTSCDKVVFKKIDFTLGEISEFSMAIFRIGCPLPHFPLTSSAGGSFVFAAGFDFRVIRVNADRTIVWDETFFGITQTSGNCNVLEGVIPAGDGGHVLFGTSCHAPGAAKTAPNFGDADYWIVKIDRNGRRQWDRSFGGAGSDWLRSAISLGDGRFLLCGSSTSEQPSGNKQEAGIGYWLVYVDRNGQKIGELVIETPAISGAQLIRTNEKLRFLFTAMLSTGDTRPMLVNSEFRPSVSAHCGCF